MIPRIVIGGTTSGAGKTTVACGIIGALRARGHVVQGFKVGPDYIDPTYHALASGRPGRNLDAFLSGPELIDPLLRHGAQGADVAVVEGVMGLFDGASGRGELASTAHVAKLLDAPVLLVVDAASMARSAAAIVHGFLTFDPRLRVSGVIFNRVGSDHHEELLRDALAVLGVPVLGALRRDERVATPERHLGLVPADEREARALAALAHAERRGRALRRPRRGAQARARRSGEHGCGLEPRAGRRAGAAERASPSRAGRRSRSTTRRTSSCSRPPGPSSRSSIRSATLRCPRAPGRSCSRAASRRSSAASSRRTRRCATRSARSRARAGRCWRSAAVCCTSRPSSTGRRCAARSRCAPRMTRRLTLGYREATAVTATPWLEAGEQVRGHEFHYSQVEPLNGGEQAAWQLAARGTERSEGFVAGGVQASFLHVHWAAFPQIASRLAAAARESV